MPQFGMWRFPATSEKWLAAGVGIIFQQTELNILPSASATKSGASHTLHSRESTPEPANIYHLELSNQMDLFFQETGEII